MIKWVVDQNLNQLAREIIEKILYITIATVTPEGKPWNSPVYSAYDPDYNFFWASWKDNQHSQNIKANSDVFLVIYDSLVSEGKGRGVYIAAKAFELTNEKEITHALKFLYGRKNKKPREAKEFLPPYPRRVYKAVPEKFWINTDAEIDGNFIDKRIEVKL